MKASEIKTTHYVFGNSSKTREHAEDMIKKFHGQTSKEFDKDNRTHYKNSKGQTVALKDRDGEGDLTWNIHEPKVLKEMNSFEKIKQLAEAAGTKYDSGVGYTARVVKTSTGKHVAKFFSKNKHMTDADYEGQNEQDAHEFAKDEMAYRKKEKMKNESVDPKDHIEQTLASADINSTVTGDTVKVHKSNKARTERILKKMGHSHKVETGLNEDLNEVRMPLADHPYHKKSDAELRFIQKDAGEAARAMKNHDPKAEAKYLDQVNDASTVLYYRKQKNEDVLNERINEPQGHKTTPDPISTDALNSHGRVKKMMGNRTPLDIISKILAGINK